MKTSTRPRSPFAATEEPEDWDLGPARWGARPLRSRRVSPGDLFLLEAAAVAALVVLAVTLLQRPLTTVLALGAGLAALGLHAARRARRARPPSDTLERRVLRRDVYGLKCRFDGGECVDELTRGTRVVIGQNPAAEVCLYAYGREYPLDPGDLRRVREASTPAARS
jgi:hypothetical protein